MSSKLVYEAPTIDLMGAFETVTQGGVTGSHFDGNFVVGQPVPFDSNGKPQIFS